MESDIYECRCTLAWRCALGWTPFLLVVGNSDFRQSGIFSNFPAGSIYALPWPRNGLNSASLHIVETVLSVGYN